MGRETIASGSARRLRRAQEALHLREVFAPEPVGPQPRELRPRLGEAPSRDEVVEEEPPRLPRRGALHRRHPRERPLGLRVAVLKPQQPPVQAVRLDPLRRVAHRHRDVRERLRQALLAEAEARHEVPHPRALRLHRDRALEEPLRQLAFNAGLEGSVVVNEVRAAKAGFGLNVDTGEMVDLVKAGIIDPAMVTRSALQNAASIAKNILTTEAIIVDAPEKSSGPTVGDMGGMGGMGGMM